MGHRSAGSRRIRLLVATAVATLLAAALGSLSVRDGTATADDIDPVEPTVLVGAGDIASCMSQGDEATADLIDGIPGSVITLGDNNYDGEQLADFERCYDPSWGRFKDRTHPAPGNHEYTVAGAPGYFDYFGAAAGERGKGYYSYDAGTWHVVVLNSNCGVVGGCGATSPQGRWLSQNLTASSASCTLAYWHHPRFSSGEHGDNPVTQPLWQTLWDNGAEIVLAGHDHDYERFAPLGADGTPDDATGIRELVVGTGGRSHYMTNVVHAYSEVRNNDTYGVIKLTLGDAGYDWVFVPVAGSTFTDAGSGTCHDKPVDSGGTDTTPPETVISAGPAASTTATSATFLFTSSEPGSTFTCATDGAVPVACSSPYTVSGLGLGAHSMSVVATDPAINADLSPATRSWTVTAPPVTRTFTATADTQAVQGSPNSSYGSATTVKSDTSPRTDGFLRFAVSGLTGTFTSAKVRVFMTDGTANGPRLALTGGSWTESGLTWRNKPAAGAVVANTARVSANAWTEYAVTAQVTGNGTYNFTVVPESSDGVVLTSRQGAASRAPQLVVVSTG